MHPFATMRRLHDRGPACRGLAVDAEGVMLGPDCSLVRHTPLGYRCADPDELARLTRDVFDGDARLSRLPIVLAGIVKALDGGDLLKAQLLGLEIPIGELDDHCLQRLSVTAGLIKDGFDPNQLRDERGRWARESGAAARMTPATPPKPSFLGRVAPAVLRALAELGARFVAPVAFLGIIFVPSNRSLISQGTLPDQPDLSFEFDEGAGRLRLYRQDNDGRSLVFEGRPDADGIIRDDEGHAIGRKLDGSVVIIDPDALPGAGSDRGGDGRPKLCPDSGDDRPGGKKDKDLAYQAYVSSLVNPEEPLEPGLAVKLFNPIAGKDVYFDDCRRSDGTMIEAKGTGYLEMLRKTTLMPWKGVETQMLGQAKRQLQAAGTRPIEWHFAEQEVADRVRTLFKERDVPITVIYSPPPK